MTSKIAYHWYLGVVTIRATPVITTAACQGRSGSENQITASPVTASTRTAMTMASFPLANSEISANRCPLSYPSSCR